MNLRYRDEVSARGAPTLTPHYQIVRSSVLASSSTTPTQLLPSVPAIMVANQESPEDEQQPLVLPPETSTPPNEASEHARRTKGSFLSGTGLDRTLPGRSRRSGRFCGRSDGRCALPGPKRIPSRLQERGRPVPARHAQRRRVSHVVDPRY